MEYFEYPAGLKMTTKNLINYLAILLEKKIQKSQFYMDIVTSTLKVTEEIVLKL